MISSDIIYCCEVLIFILYLFALTFWLFLHFLIMRFKIVHLYLSNYNLICSQLPSAPLNTLEINTDYYVMAVMYFIKNFNILLIQLSKLICYLYHVFNEILNKQKWWFCLAVIDTSSLSLSLLLFFLLLYKCINKWY